MIDAGIRRLVRERAKDRCEYCGLHQENSELIHHIEHVIARQHGGLDHVDNLALACHRCNLQADSPYLGRGHRSGPDIMSRQFKQPKEGLGYDNSPVAHMWRSMIRPDSPL